MSGFIPERGNLIWLRFSPQTGREQAGKHPALVLSPKAYNAKVGLAVVCPVTSKAKGYPFEVKLPTSGKIQGVVLADHVRSVDWKARRAVKAGQAPPSAVAEVLGKLRTLLG